MEISLDVLIIGGGVQGLWLLNDLCDLGYASFLITRGALGVGQTLHSHVYIHRGHLYTRVDLIRRLRDVTERWNQFIRKKALTLPDTKPLFILPLPASALWRRLWEEADLPFCEDEMPSIFGSGILSRGKALRTFETWLDGEELVRKLSEPVAGLIRRGEVVSIDLGQSRVLVEIEHQRFVFNPKLVVIAAGSGNRALLQGAAEHDSDLHARVSRAQRLRNSLMVVFKGPELPKLTCIIPEFPLFMVCRQEGEETVWLGSYGVDEEVASGNDVGPFLDPPVPSDRVQQTVSMLHALAPELIQMDLSWGAYTGLKSEHVPQARWVGVPSEEAVEDFGRNNLVVVWPTKLTLAPRASSRIVEMIHNKIGAGSGRLVPADLEMPNTMPVVGQEKWKTVEWMKWSLFKARHNIRWP